MIEFCQGSVLKFHSNLASCENSLEQIGLPGTV